MKIILFSRPRVNHNAEELRQILSEIELRGFEYIVNWEFAPTLERLLGLRLPKEQIYGERVGRMSEAECKACTMLCVGGDGTLLDGVHRLDGQAVVVVGINFGRLGFLTCTSKSDIAQLFDDIERGQVRVDERTMLSAAGDFSCGEWLNGVNELAVHRHVASMIAVEILVDGEQVAVCHGDGVIVSTPTGSTAYSLSAGGAILAPRCGAWLISPLAPHNITMRPMAIPDGSDLELVIRMREGDATISVDNRTFGISQTTRLSIRRSQSKLLLGQNRNVSFYKTLRDKMMWGVDLRESRKQ